MSQFDVNIGSIGGAPGPGVNVGQQVDQQTGFAVERAAEGLRAGANNELKAMLANLQANNQMKEAELKAKLAGEQLAAQKEQSEAELALRKEQGEKALSLEEDALAYQREQSDLDRQAQLSLQQDQLSMQEAVLQAELDSLEGVDEKAGNRLKDAKSAKAKHEAKLARVAQQLGNQRNATVATGDQLITEMKTVLNDETELAKNYVSRFQGWLNEQDLRGQNRGTEDNPLRRGVFYQSSTTGGTAIDKEALQARVLAINPDLNSEQADAVKLWLDRGAAVADGSMRREDFAKSAKLSARQLRDAGLTDGQIKGIIEGLKRSADVLVGGQGVGKINESDQLDEAFGPFSGGSIKDVQRGAQAGKLLRATADALAVGQNFLDEDDIKALEAEFKTGLLDEAAGFGKFNDKMFAQFQQEVGDPEFQALAQEFQQKLSATRSTAAEATQIQGTINDIMDEIGQLTPEVETELSATLEKAMRNRNESVLDALKGIKTRLAKQKAALEKKNEAKN